MHATLVRRTSPIFPWSSVVTSASVMGLHGAGSSDCQPSNRLQISLSCFRWHKAGILPARGCRRLSRPPCGVELRREGNQQVAEIKHGDNKANLNASLTFGRFGCEGAFFRFVTSSNKV